AGFKAGLAVVPINMRLHPREVEYIARNSEASAVVFDPVLDVAAALTGALRSISGLRLWEVHDLPEASAVDDWPDPPDAALAWLFYTSGTTGRPKGAMLSHANLMAMSDNCLTDLYAFGPDDIALHVAPLSHGTGLYLLPAMTRGAFNILQSGSFDVPTFFRLVAERRITVVPFMVPTHITALVEHPDARSTDL